MLIQSQPTQSFASPLSPQSRLDMHTAAGMGSRSNGMTAGSQRVDETMDLVTYSNLVNGSIFSLPKSWSQEHTDDMLVTVYSFVKTFVGASGAGQGTIDNRIEQAMDLVKSHLMSAVRSEVEELRDKISKLEESVTVLSRENELLRANVNPDILANLSGSTTSRHHQIQQPPDCQQTGGH